VVVSFAKCLQLLCHVLVQYGHVLLQLLLSQRFELKILGSMVKIDDV
jgi:hypothetical protein